MFSLIHPHTRRFWFSYREETFSVILCRSLFVLLLRPLRLLLFQIPPCFPTADLSVEVLLTSSLRLTGHSFLHLIESRIVRVLFSFLLLFYFILMHAFLFLIKTLLTHLCILLDLPSTVGSQPVRKGPVPERVLVLWPQSCLDLTHTLGSSGVLESGSKDQVNVRFST